MAGPETGMEKADMKRLLEKSKKEPVSVCVALGEKNVGLMLLHRTKSGRALKAELEKQFDTVRNARFGTAFVDLDDNPKLVKLTLNQKVTGLARPLAKTLKGTGFKRVMLVGEDGITFEDEAEEEEGEAPGVVAEGPGVPPPPGPPPPPGAPPPPGMTPEQVAAATAQLTRVLGELIKKIPGAAGEDAARREELTKLAREAGTEIKTGNLKYAAITLKQLEAALKGPPPKAFNADQARREWGDLHEAVHADVGKLRAALADAYKGHPQAGEISQAFDKKVAPLVSRFNGEVAQAIESFEKAAPGERDGIAAQVRKLVDSAVAFARTDPAVAELDENPFAPLAIRKAAEEAAGYLEKALG